MRARLGPAFDAWANKALPAAIDAASRHWGVEVGQAFESGATAAVFRATHPTAGDSVLKVIPDQVHFEGEQRGWALWGGKGFPTLLGQDARHQMILQARVFPGRHMEEAGASTLVKQAAQLLQTLSRQPPPTGWPTLEERVAHRNSEVSHYLANGVTFDRSVIEGAQRIAQRLLETSKELRAVHGDYFPNNVVESGEQWLAIDPQPHVGDAAFDAGTWCYGAKRGADIDKLSKAFGSEAGIDVDRIVGWSLYIAATNLVFRIAWDRTTSQEVSATTAFIESHLGRGRSRGTELF